MEEQAPRGDGPSAWTAYAVYGGAGIQLAAAVVAGYWIGQYVDGRWGTGPWLGILGVALGFTGGLVNLVRIVRVLTRDGKKGERDGPDDA